MSKEPVLNEVIAMSPWRHETETIKSRAVIREFSDQYVVHSESREGENIGSYYWGHYYPKSSSTALEDAVEAFTRKTKSIFNLPL